MPTRRTLLATLLVGGAALSATTARADDAATARQFINKLLQELISVVNGAGGADQKRAALQQLIDGSVDVPGVARFCLGRFWNQASPPQRTEYVALFRKVLMTNVTGRVGEYSGVSFAMGNSQARDGGIAVSTTVTRPRNAPNQVDWIVAMAGGQPKVIDVVAEGTSLRLTQRSDYASFLGQHNGDVAALIAAMKRQAS
jgi:phospholipid transport system substrate-binding protein